MRKWDGATRGHCCLPELFEIEFERDKGGKRAPQSQSGLEWDGKAVQSEAGPCGHRAASQISYK